MKIFKRAVIILVAVVLLVQIPFIYRRYTIGSLADTIARSEATRGISRDLRSKEYKGIIHAHTSLGGHTNAGFEELIAAADSNALDFVVLTEHYSDQFDTAALTLNGVYGRTLFIGGNEIDTADGDRFLLVPGMAEAVAFQNMPTHEVLSRAHENGRLVFVTHPERLKTWDANFDGIEAFSLHTEAKKANPFAAAFDLLWTFPAYPELLLAEKFQRPDLEIRRFDETSTHRKVSIFGGTDAHSNIGVHLFGDETGKSFVGAKLDPFASAFRLTRLHVLLPIDAEFDRETLLNAMRRGNFFTGFDVHGDTTGASFTAESGEVTAIIGDEISFAPNMKFTAKAPQPARFEVFKNGELFAVSDVDDRTSFQIVADGPGVYRLEVYRTQLGAHFKKTPWIMTNPIYVR